MAHISLGFGIKLNLATKIQSTYFGAICISIFGGRDKMSTIKSELQIHVAF